MPLTTLERVKQYRNVTTTEHDAELTRLITAVDGYVAQYCDRVLEQTTLTEYYSPPAGETQLRLRQWPVAVVLALYDDPTRTYDPASLIPVTSYAVDPSGLLTLLDRTWSGGPQSVRVEYVAGYANGSPDRALLEQAAIELVWLAHTQGDQALLGVRGRRLGDGSLEQLELGWPSTARAILDRYRRLEV